MSERKKIKPEVIQRLLARSGNKCAFPKCNEPIFTDEDVYVGNYCHINAVKRGGKRYDSALSEEYINSYENIILLCSKHHKVIDTVEDKYTVSQLKKFKLKHEKTAKESVISAELINNALTEYYIQLAEIFNEILDLKESNEQLHAKIDEILLRTKPHISIVESKDDYFSIHLKSLTTLKQKGNYNAALALLLEYKGANWKQLTEENKYKLILNIGLTHFDLQQFKDASKNLIDLKKFKVDIKLKYSFIGIGYALANKTKTAKLYATKAINLDKFDVNAYGILVQTNHYKSLEDVKQNIPSIVFNASEMQLSIGKFLEGLDQYDEAVNTYEKIISSKSKKNGLILNDSKTSLALALYSSIKYPELFSVKQLSEESIHKIKRAISLLDEAIAYFKSTDLLYSRSSTIVNKGILQKILTLPKEAEKSFLYALSIKKDYFPYRNLIIQNIATDKAIEYIRDATKLNLSADQKVELILLECEYLLIKKDYLKSLDLLKTIQHNLLEESVNKEHYYITYFDLLINLDQWTELSKNLDNLSEDDSVKFIFLFYSTQLFFKEDKQDLYSKTITSLITFLDEKRPFYYSMYVLKILSLYRDYKNSILILTKIVDKTKFSELSRNLIYALYKEGNYQEGANWANNYIKINQQDEFVIDILSNIYLESEEINKAVDLIEIYIKQFANNSLRIKLANLYMRIGNPKKCIINLNSITNIETFNVDTQFRIAYAYLKCGEIEKGISIGYNFRRKNFHSGDAHAKYIQLITLRRDLPYETIFPVKIQNDCYVLLEHGNAKQEFILCSDPILTSELDINNVTAQALLEHTLNDSVQIGNEEFSITSILGKFTYALHESMNFMETRFPEFGFKIFKTDPNNNSEENLSPIFKLIDNDVKLTEEANSFYKKGQSTIGFMAEFFHQNTIRYWQSVVSNYDLGIHSLSSLDQKTLVKALLESNIGLVLDITVLLQLYYNQRLFLLNLLNNKKYITKSSFEIIENEINILKDSLSDGEYHTIFKLNGVYYRNTITIEDTKNRIKYLEEFYRESKQYVETLSPELSENFNKKKEMDDVLGVSFNDTMILAEKGNLLLFSDDSIFRQLSYDEKHVVGFSSYMFYCVLFEKNLIKEDLFNQCVLDLIKLNYRNLPVSGKLIYMAFDADGFKTLFLCERTVESLISEQNVDIKAIVVCHFLKNLYLNDQLLDKREYATIWILRAYFKQLGSKTTKLVLIKYLRLEFILLQFQLEKILQIMTFTYPFL